MYEMNDEFFKEIDQSIHRRCKKMQDVQPYTLQFQAFIQDIMMLTGNLMKFKLRLPSFFKSAIRNMTEKTVNDIFNKNDFTDASVMKTVVACVNEQASWLLTEVDYRFRISRRDAGKEGKTATSNDDARIT